MDVKYYYMALIISLLAGVCLYIILQGMDKFTKINQRIDEMQSQIDEIKRKTESSNKK